MILSSVPVPSSGIHHKQEDTKAFVDSLDLGVGVLYITDDQVAWVGTTGGFTLNYPNISLHAVSRDVSSFPQECLYLMIDQKLTEEEKQDNSSDEEEDKFETETSEVRFIPADKGTLEAMFGAMSDCQALHPDPDDTDSEAEDDQYYEGEEGVDHLTEQGQATLQRLENMLQTGQGDGPYSEGTETVTQPNGTVEHMEDSGTGGQFDDADMEQ